MKRAFLFLLFISTSALAQTERPARSFALRGESPRFWELIDHNAQLERMATGFGFTEGPVWDPSGFVYVSDEEQNMIYRVYADGRREELIALGDPDGNTYDKDQKLIDCASVLRAIIRIEANGRYAVLADRFEGKRFNSPNDVVSKRNGDIYFTDPPGLYRNYPEGAAGAPKQELDFNGLYRITAAGKLDLLARDIPFPNGLAFSPDEKKLYVSNTRPEKKWMVYDVKPDGGIANGKVFLDMTKEPGEGVPDGMKVDEEGNLYATGPGGVLVVSAKGKHLGTIQLPETPSNCAFGDADGQTLFITARTSVYRIRLKVAGRLP